MMIALQTVSILPYVVKKICFGDPIFANVTMLINKRFNKFKEDFVIKKYQSPK